MKSVVLEKEQKFAAKSALSIFDPRRHGTDEDTLLKERRPDLYELKKNPSEKYRLARRIFELRTAAGLSQAQLAAKAGIGSATYQRIEECQPSANPRLDVLDKLARAFGVDVQTLFGKNGSQTAEIRIRVTPSLKRKIETSLNEFGVKEISDFARGALLNAIELAQLNRDPQWREFIAGVSEGPAKMFNKVGCLGNRGLDTIVQKKAN